MEKLETRWEQRCQKNNCGDIPQAKAEVSTENTVASPVWQRELFLSVLLISWWEQVEYSTLACYLYTL